MPDFLSLHSRTAIDLSCVTLTKLLILPVPLFAYLWNRDNNNTWVLVLSAWHNKWSIGMLTSVFIIITSINANHCVETSDFEINDYPG